MNESDPPLFKKQSVSVSQTSPKPEDLLFKNFSDVYGNKDDVFEYKNPMNDNAPMNYLKRQNDKSRYEPSGGKTRRRSKYNKKSRRGGRGVFGSTFTKGGRGRKRSGGGKSRKSRRGGK